MQNKYFSHETIAKHCAIGPNYLQSRTWGKLEDARHPEGITAYLALTDYPTINMVIMRHGSGLPALLDNRKHLQTVAAAWYRVLAIDPMLRKALEAGDYTKALVFLATSDIDYMRESIAADRQQILENISNIERGHFHAGY